MPVAEATLPSRLPELVLRPAPQQGQYVVKNPRSGTYLELGEAEFFLLSRLDGRHSGEALRIAFEQQFADPLSDEDLQDFVQLAKSQGLLDDGRSTDSSVKPRKRQSILYYRYSLFDPDQFLNWLEPKVRIFWSRTFVIVSAAMILMAALTLWQNRADLSLSFHRSVRVETLVIAWLIIVGSTFCHEFAHGLTVKRYGGEVHEIGVLLLFFTPCFYCNVSDAWLIPQKSRRLLVTLAGGYCDLCVWTIAVFVWRITIQDTLVNYLAWVIVSVCGARIFFNFNPFMKLDGYYLMSDWLGIPNLRRRAKEYWMSHLRWLLWGAPRPERIERGRFLLGFGAFTWLFSVAFIDVMFMGLCQWLGARWGFVGVLFGLFLGYLVIKRLFRGFEGGEMKTMLKQRPWRTRIWLGGVALALAVLCIARMQDRTGGAFQVRPGIKAELRAAVAGFLREVKFDEGDRISEGTLIARLEVPDLVSLTTQKQAEVRESLANLRRLEAGPRKEELLEAQRRVERAVAWRDLAIQDLARGRQQCDEELAHLGEQIEQFRTEVEYSRKTLTQSEDLYRKGGLAGQQLMAERKKLQVSESQWEQAQAKLRARQAQGALQFEAELARREKELADTKAALALLEAGTRPEDIEAERAHQARLKEELAYLESLRDKVLVTSPVAGIITTGRLKEKIGQYFEKGDLICVVEDVSGLEAEIALPEQEVAAVATGQVVELKARALPFTTFTAKVDRIAPAAVVTEGEPQSRVVVYCRVNNPEGLLRSGMTGFGRIYRDSRPVAAIVSTRALRYLRTEFWW